MQWYYAKGTKQFGPVEEAELFKLAKTRELDPEDLVWNSSMGNEWVKASTVPALFDTSAQASPTKLTMSTKPTMPAPVPAPASAPRNPAPGGDSSLGSVSNRDLMRMARESLANRWGFAIKIFLLYMLIAMCANILPALGPTLLIGPLLVGLYMVFLLIARGSEAKIDNLFDGFKCFGTALCAYLLMALFVFLWMLLFIIPGIIAGLSYSMTFFIIADDPSIGPMEAINKSKQMMQGYKWKLFCMGFRFIGWVLLCLCTCGIGFFWLAPYKITALAHFYEDVRRQS